ncbi:myb-like protein [Saprolegnia diclina VS20]|uniref:Myb-like protein n=1 Tax=Saprolegnia diclina (strain VS20) TaxID=1156394 RepID=T0RCG5_SAPDV|nr:myb-like protein [Saprolegnia diclina VS20]EQC29908.1 myb-like protein [Saprolegnia diclina VS20]|eukprot:XP_008616747.1 myb-like protein [Saprolegnia diclina VS20]
MAHCLNTTMAGAAPSGRDSIGSIMHEFVDSFPIDVDARQSISDLGKVLFTESQKPADANAPKKPYQMPKEIKGIPRQKQQDVTGITASGRVALPQGSVRKLLQTQGKATPMRWTPEEDDALRKAVEAHGERNWKSIAEVVPGRNHTQCLQRWTKVLAPGLIKGHWRPDEDDILRQLVAEGRKNWGQVATRIPGRTSKQCRERWYNHLDPNIVRGEYTAEEDQIILEAQQRIGNRWSAIAAMLPGRTEDAVKIRWKSLCRTKSGRNRRNTNEKDPNDNSVSPITVTAVASEHKAPSSGMGYPQRSMMSELQSPMLHNNGNSMHPSMANHHHGMYQGHDMYNQSYPSPHHQQQHYHQGGFNAADQFMHKMNPGNGGGYDANYHNPSSSYGQYPPMGYPRGQYTPHQQPYPTQDGSNYHPTHHHHVQQPPQQHPTQAHQPVVSQPTSSVKMDLHAGSNMSFPMGNPAASFAQQMRSSSPPTNEHAFKPPAPMRQSSGSTVASSFVQSLSSGGKTESKTPLNIAASFAQAHYSAPKSPGNDGIPSNPFLKTNGGNANHNVAASFAAQAAGGRPNLAAAFAQQQQPMMSNNSDDAQNKRPRLPLSMDAARASAARRMRQNDNHGDFVNGSDAPPPPGDVNRLSVSDINLSELGPIEEMWRVSSDMNRLSL